MWHSPKSNRSVLSAHTALSRSPWRYLQPGQCSLARVPALIFNLCKRLLQVPLSCPFPFLCPFAARHVFVYWKNTLNKRLARFPISYLPLFALSPSLSPSLWGKGKCSQSAAAAAAVAVWHAAAAANTSFILITKGSNSNSNNCQSNHSYISYIYHIIAIYNPLVNP